MWIHSPLRRVETDVIRAAVLPSRRSRFVFGLVLWIAAAISGHAVPPSAVTVEKTPVQIERKTFDPENPPANMPAHAPLEAGLCESRFGCETQIEVSLPHSRKKAVQGTIIAMKLKTQLGITLWVAENSPKKISDHEEAHRAIAEHYYATGDAVAHRLAVAAIGRKVTVAMRDKKPAIEEALNDLQNETLAMYLNETARRCNFAQDRFDAITDHSRNPIPERDAEAQALQEEEAHYAEEVHGAKIASPTP